MFIILCVMLFFMFALFHAGLVVQSLCIAAGIGAVLVFESRR